MNETERAFSSLLQRVNELERIVGEMKTAENPVQWDGTAVTIQQTGWIAPTFLGAWANYGGAWATAGYRKDSTGIVHLKGLVRSGAVGTIFILPVGYRPTQNRIFIVSSDVGGTYSFSRVDVTTAGAVNWSIGGGSTYFSLDGIKFDTL